jgi:hypothetical protein
VGDVSEPEPCICLLKVLRAVTNGTAHCNRHMLHGEKIAGTVRASKTPFRSSFGTLHLRKRRKSL